MRVLTAVRYVTPLREGGSLPAVVETDDGALMVVKFRGAGQGPRALVAEWIVGELARAAGLRVPAIARVELDGAFGRNEPDPEIRDLLRASTGPNLGLAYLPGAIAYDPIAPPEVDERTASAVVWLDAYVRNVDRSPRNPNLLLWDGGLWLIDHGAALYFHHAWDSAPAHVRGAFAPIRDHVLLHRAGALAAADAAWRPVVRTALAGGLLDALPDVWLPDDPVAGDAARQRNAYRDWLERRLDASEGFVKEAEDARRALV
jgi:hypothetical protein